MQRRVKVIVQKTEDGYVAYPLGVKGVVVGDGDSETVQSPGSKVQGLKASGKGEIIAIKRFEDIEAWQTRGR